MTSAESRRWNRATREAIRERVASDWTAYCLAIGNLCTPVDVERIMANGSPEGVWHPAEERERRLIQRDRLNLDGLDTADAIAMRRLWSRRRSGRECYRRHTLARKVALLLGS